MPAVGFLFSLGLGQNQSFGPKKNTKFGVRTTHPPKTFWRVPGIVGGQDLVCRLPIVQGTSAHSFDPPLQFFLTQKCFGSKIFGTKSFLIDFFGTQNYFSTQIFLNPKFSWIKSFFLTSNFFDPNIFLDPNFFFDTIFFTQNFLGWSKPKSYQAEHLRT